MLDAIVERQRQFGRRVVTAKRRHGPRCDFGEVDFAVLGKHHGQLCGGKLQYIEQSLQYIPLRVLVDRRRQAAQTRSEEHTSELQSLMRTSYACFCLKKNTRHRTQPTIITNRLYHL